MWTVKQAAEHAEVSERTIWQWIQKHGLSKYTQGHHTLVDPMEVNAVIDAKRSPDRFVPSAQLLGVIIRRIEKMEREIEVLRFANGNRALIDIDEDSAILLYQIAVRSLEMDQNTAELHSLVNVVEGVTEEALEIIQRIKSVSHPWLPFFRLALKLQRTIRKKKTYSTNLEHQTDFNRLQVAIERLRAMGLIYIEADLDPTTRATYRKEVGAATATEADLLHRVLQREAPRNPQQKNTKNILQKALRLVDDKDSAATVEQIVALLQEAISTLRVQK